MAGTQYPITNDYGFVIFKSLKYPIVPISTNKATETWVIFPFILSATNGEYFATHFVNKPAPRFEPNEPGFK